MQQFQTHIDIEAPASLVWANLADFGRYQRWSPLIRGVLRGRLRGQLGFDAMNTGLKRRAERACETSAAATR